ncbi:MAG TPA: TRAP transporter large permease [Firmicutes bacterium]|nr:TRAP transporter large permease [Bacillota bacterium]
MTITLFILFLTFLLVGVPIGVSIGLASACTLALAKVPLVVVPQRMFAGADSFPLMAVPFFVLAGDIMAKGTMSKRLVEFAENFVGYVKGGLGIVAVLASMFFAAICGSGAATAAAVGAPLVPQLKERGYDMDFSAALIAAAGTIGVVIPPSVPMVLYATVADQSVARLFLGGFLPGIMMGVVLMAFNLFVAHKKNLPSGKPFQLVDAIGGLNRSILGLATPVIILGGIFSGKFTATEASCIAVVYALVVSLFIYRDLQLRDLYKIFVDSAVTTCLVMFVIATCNIFSWVMASLRIPEAIARGLLSITTNKYLVLLIINAIILLIGTFMETASALILTVPIFLPVVNKLGIDLVHFGLIITIGLAIGMITPPVAINLYVAGSVAGISMERISKAVVPMVIALVGVLLVVTYLPTTVLAIPNWLMP